MPNDSDRPGGIRRTIAELPPSKIGEVSMLALGDKSVIPLWYGEGDLPTPGFIGEAAAAALRDGHTFYTYKAGLPELRATIATYLSGLYGEIGPERVAVTSSGMTALTLVAQALLDPGDNRCLAAGETPECRAPETRVCETGI